MSANINVDISSTDNVSVELSAATLTSADFTDLFDTPSSYSGAGEYFLKVKATEDGVEFVDVSIGTAITLDLGDDGGNDSTDLQEIATSGDTNNIFTEPSADKLLIDVSQNWPTADLADGLNAGAIDAIGDFNASLLSGSDTTLITGTAGTSGNAVSWNVDGDAVDSGVAISDILQTSDIGSTVQAYDAQLASIAGLAPGAEGRMITADGLGGFQMSSPSQVRGYLNVEDGADVTDATNVDAAGAVMNSDTSTISMSFVIDEDDMISDSATKVPTQQSVKAYADTKASASHTHAASDITSGTFDDARIAQSNVTQHQAALSITESQISDFGSYIGNLVEDLTPQLGGNLDLNSSNITGTGNVAITGKATFTHNTNNEGIVLHDGTQALGEIVKHGADDSGILQLYDGGVVTSSITGRSGQPSVIVGTLRVDGGSVGSPGFTFGNDTDTGVYRIGANNLGLATAGTLAIDIDSSQNVSMPNGTLNVGSSVAVDSVKDEDNMSSNSATALATQQSIKAYVDAEIAAQEEAFVIAITDETTAVTTGTGKITFRMPFAMTLTAVRATLTGAGSTSGTTTVDINEGGTTILSTKLTIDYGEKTSTTAATAAVISDSALADDAEITIDVDAVTGGADETGLKVYLIGTRA